MWLENVFKHVPKNDHPYIKSVYYDGCDKNITSFPVAEDTIQRSFTTLEKELLHMCSAPQINDEKCTHQVNWLYNEYEWMKNKHGFWEPKHDSHVKPMNISTLELFSQHHQDLVIKATNDTTPNHSDLHVVHAPKDKTPIF